LPAVEAAGPTLTVSALGRRLAVHTPQAVPLLVVRLPALERTAWREGLRKARSLEKRACAAFAGAAADTLRGQDLIAHDRGSDVFLAALAAPMRGDASALGSGDARSALARIAARMESATRLDVETGWTTLTGGEPADLPAAVARGLARGAQERERYAFFSALGHELRTPLASIRGYLETLLDAGLDGPTQARFLSIAYKESLRLSRLVEGMFEISLLDLQTTLRAPSGGPLHVALDAALDACAASAAARKVTVTRRAVPPLLTELDTDRLALVFINIVENAIKHGRPGGFVEIGVDLTDARFACVTVDDDGPGVAPAERDRIFALGARGSTAASGSGIGLALVRLMLERARGRVDIGDSPLGGARFRILLPRIPEREDRENESHPVSSSSVQRAI
jgi:signal transduction histidine kinase